MSIWKLSDYRARPDKHVVEISVQFVDCMYEAERVDVVVDKAG